MASEPIADAPPAAVLRAAQLAHVLARAVRQDELAPGDALRVLRHELRRRNTNKKLAIAVRSVEAQRVIEHYGPTNVPKNGSGDALHADHVYPLTEAKLRRTLTVDAWLIELARVALVVCVTADENYRLERFEKQGVNGPAKYAKAGVEFTTAALPWKAPGSVTSAAAVSGAVT